MQQKQHKIITPVNLVQEPDKWEKSAARLLATHLETDVEFVPTTIIGSPDYKIKNQIWELKTPKGNGKNNIQHVFQRAKHQAPRLIVDARRSKMYEPKLIRDIKKELSIRKNIKGLIIIHKDKSIEIIK